MSDNDGAFAGTLSERVTTTLCDHGLAADVSVADALRGDQTSATHVCMNLLATGEVDALVSAAPTGAMVALGRRYLSMLPGFSRPPLCSAFPAGQGHTYVLDLGANVEVSAAELAEFAHLGAALFRALHNKLTPAVYLLSNGAEASKGNTRIREAAGLLDDATGLSYKGFIEGDDLYSGKADLVVCDGLLGNVALKTAEGTARYALAAIDAGLQKSGWRRICLPLLKPVFKTLRSSLSDQRHGGAFLLGLQGVVVKSHGAATAEGFAASLSQALRCVDAEMILGLQSVLRNTSQEP